MVNIFDGFVVIMFSKPDSFDFQYAVFHTHRMYQVGHSLVKIESIGGMIIK